MDTRGQRLQDWSNWHATAFGLTRPDPRRRGRFLPMQACSPASGLIACRSDWDRGLDHSFPTLAEFLARHGYATAGFVANTYYCNARYGLDRGFARYEDFHENQTISLFEAVRCTSLGKCLLGLMGYSMDFAPAEKNSRKTAATMNQDALDWLAQRRSGRPFFLFLNYYDAHAPFVPPEEASKRFGLCALPRSEQVKMLKSARQLDQEKESFENRGLGSERDFNGRQSKSWLMATTAASPISTTRSAASSMS